MANVASEKAELFLKIAGFIALLVSGIFTLYKLREDRRVDVGHQEQSLNSYIFQQQASLFFETSRVAASLATSQDTKKRAEARERFDELYWGQLVMVEDRRVELAMIAFESCFDEPHQCARSSQTQHNLPLPANLKDANASNLSLELSACLRRALEEDRHIQFGNIAPAETKCPYD